MGIENDINQRKFKSEYQKAIVNLIYTYNWTTERLKLIFDKEDITLQQFNILRILRGQHPKAANINMLKERMLDRMSDVSRLVDDGTTGFIVPRENMTLLVDRLAALIHDSQLCSRMGAAGREKAEREFTLAKMVSETLAAYRAVGWSGTEGVGQCYKIQTTE